MSFVEDLHKKSIISIIKDFRWLYVWIIFSFIPLILLWWFGEQLRSQHLGALTVTWAVACSGSYLAFVTGFAIRMRETLRKWSRENWAHLLVPCLLALALQWGVCLFLIR